MNKIQLMDIKRQHDEHALEYETAAIKTLRSGQYIGGQEVQSFEIEFSEYVNSKYAISCGNGTDALKIALSALNIRPGDEIITVAFTFFATAESIASIGAIPVFVDVCEDTYCINPNLIEEKITKKTKAIVVVHIYGQSADMDEINRIAAKYNLYVISDCAQSTGAKYKGLKNKLHGDISCYSFFPTKNLGGDGDGGMIVTDNIKIAKACLAFKVHGSGINGLETLKNQYLLNNIHFPESIPNGESKYYNYLIGYNSRLDAIQASILRVKLKYLNDFIKRRRNNARIYNEQLINTNYKLPVEGEFNVHSYYIYALYHEKAKDIMKSLIEKKISCGTYYPVPLHLQGAFVNLGYKLGDLPITEKLCKNTFAIPVFPELAENERDYIVKVLIELDK